MGEETHRLRSSSVRGAGEMASWKRSARRNAPTAAITMYEAIVALWVSMQNAALGWRSDQLKQNLSSMVQTAKKSVL